MNTTIHFRLIASQSIFHYFSFWQYNFNSAIFQIELYISKQTQVDFSYDNCNQYTKHIYLHSVNLNSSSKKGKPHRYAYAETLISNLIACGAFSSVQFSCSVVSDSLQPHGLQHSPGFPVHHRVAQVIHRTYVTYNTYSPKPQLQILPDSTHTTLFD